MLEPFDIEQQSHPFLAGAFYHDPFANQANPEEGDRKRNRH